MVSNLEIVETVRRALFEDRVADDVTTKAVLGERSERLQATVRCREGGVFSGESVVEAFGQLLSPEIQFQCLARDGQVLAADQALVSLQGDAALCLAVERCLLNFLSFSCGIASRTRAFVDAIGASSTKILATRKTLPGLRALQLAAVVHGGGQIHRRNLSDGILIKDNHLLLSGLSDAIEAAKQSRSPLHRVEVEVDTLEQLREALRAQPDVVMLDNFTLEQVTEALACIPENVKVEVSGGVQLENVPAIAALGVHYISVGRLTHSVDALDLTLEFESR